MDNTIGVHVMGKYSVRNSKGEELIVQTDGDRISVTAVPGPPWVASAEVIESLRTALGSALGEVRRRES